MAIKVISKRGDHMTRDGLNSHVHILNNQGGRSCIWEFGNAMGFGYLRETAAFF